MSYTKLGAQEIGTMNEYNKYKHKGTNTKVDAADATAATLQTMFTSVT